MNDEAARDVLRDAVADAQVGLVPADDLVRRGTATRRRHRLGQVGAVAAAVAGLILGGVALTSGDSQDSAPPVAGGTQVLEAPEGMRYVGMGRVIVAVPEGWGTNEVTCGTVLADSVVFDTAGHDDCLPLVKDDPASVHIVGADSSLGRAWLNAEGTTTEVDGVSVTRTATLPLDSRPVFVSAVVVASEGAVLWAEAPERATVSTILDSVRIVPDGYVTIPFDPNTPLGPSQDLMDEAGLDVQIVEVYRKGWSPGSLISSDPPLGTPVVDGSTVTLTVTGERPDGEPAEAWPPTGPDVERPAAAECVHFYPQDLDDLGTAVDATVTKVVLGKPEDGLAPATVTLDVHEVISGDVPSTVEARAFDADWLLPSDPQKAVGVRIITTLGEDQARSLPACGFTRPWSQAELNLWHAVYDDSVEPVTPEDWQIAQALHDFAVDPSEETFDRIPFADRVGLGLASEIYTTMPIDHVNIHIQGKADLSDPFTWRIDVEHFRAHTGPFTALKYLRESTPDFWRLSTGAHSTCAAPVVEPSPELADYRQLSIQPAEGTFTSCLDWWSVDIFTDDVGRIQAITLDIYEP